MKFRYFSIINLNKLQKIELFAFTILYLYNKKRILMMEDYIWDILK